MMLVSLISYIDRSTLAILAPTILRETGLSAEQYGYVISAFSIAYMAGNPAWGIALDRFGLRWGMAAAVTIWTLASASHALAAGFATFACARALLGFGEGATFPGGLRTAVVTLPPDKRARGTALAYSGGSLGAVVTPLIVTPVAAWFGWRAAFWFTGVVGFSWLLLWVAVSRSLPHPVTHASTKVSPPRIGDRRLWGFMASYALGGLPLAFVIYGAALYLSRDRGLSQVELGKLLWIPPLGWEVGYFVWGWLADHPNRKLGSFGNWMGAAAALSLPLALAPAAPNVPVLMSLLFLAMFVAAGFVILSITYATRVFSTGSAGLIAGLGAGSWSALVAVLMPVFGRLFDARQWGMAFLLAALLPVAGYGCWFVLRNAAHDSR